MKKHIILLPVVLLLVANIYGQNQFYDTNASQAEDDPYIQPVEYGAPVDAENELGVGEEVQENQQTISHEFNTSFSYAGGSDVSQGNWELGTLSSMSNEAKYVLSIPVDEGILLRLGGHWQRFSFGVPDGPAPIPNTLQSTSGIIGADIELTDSVMMRVEFEPGIYSDFEDISFDDFNAPAIIGFSYLVDKDLQWFFGMQIDPRSYLPVMPGIGFRWAFADQWTLMFLVPKPRLEYQFDKDWMFYVGAEIKSGGYQLSKDFGRRHGRGTDLDNDRVDYREISTGAGVSWGFMPGMKLEVEGGWVIDRRFESNQSDLIIDSEGAPYGQVAISAAF